MNDELKIIHTELGCSVAVDNDQDGLYLSIAFKGGSVYCTLNKTESRELLTTIQSILGANNA